MAKKGYSDPLRNIPSSVDIIYLLGMIISFIGINFFTHWSLYLAYPILFWSLYQDWRSARVAEQRHHWYFLISDLVTVFNYICLFISATLPGSPELGYSERIWLHWGGIFFIYIVWNGVMIILPDTDKESRRFFLKFSLIEIPLVLYCWLIFFEVKFKFLLTKFNFNLIAHPGFLILLMTFFHSLILFYWVLQTYFESRPSSAKKQ